MTDTSAECSARAFNTVMDERRLEQKAESEFLLYPSGATADEITDRLIGQGMNVDVLSVRPRVSALKYKGIVIPTGEKRYNCKRNLCAVLIHRTLYERFMTQKNMQGE